MRAAGRLLRASLVAGLAITAWGPPAAAHRAATGNAVPEAAIAIPNLSHGQMGVIADNSGAIMDLAARQFPTDPVMRRLEGFIAIQRFTCLWGIVPGSLKDEDSPFNECTHAYLAATRALLMHLQGMPGDRTAVRSLVTTIELEMLQNNASLVLCRYSDEPFDTADFITPHLGPVPLDPINLGRMSIAAALSGWLATYAIRRKAGMPGDAHRAGTRVR